MILSLRWHISKYVLMIRLACFSMSTNTRLSFREDETLCLLRMGLRDTWDDVESLICMKCNVFFYVLRYAHSLNHISGSRRVSG